MIVQCDDDLYRVDRVFLGPKGKPWPFRLTYRGWGLCGGLTVVIIVVWRLLHLPWHAVFLVAAVIVAFLAAQWLDHRLIVDRPMVAEVERLAQELTAPRPDLDSRPVVVSASIVVPRWKQGAVPDARWWRRLVPGIASAGSKVYSLVTGRRKGRVYLEGTWRDVQ